jgi:hypothetical protein
MGEREKNGDSNPKNEPDPTRDRKRNRSNPNKGIGYNNKNKGGDNMEVKKATIQDIIDLLDENRKRKSKWELSAIKDGEPLLIEGARAGQIAGLRWRIKQRFPHLVLLAKPIGIDPNVRESENKTIYRAVIMTKTDYEKAAQQRKTEIKVKGVKEITTK